MRFPTDLKREYRTLRESERTWRSLVENAPDTIFIVDCGGRILFVNHGMEHAPVDDLMERHLHTLFSPKYHDDVRACLQRVCDTSRSESFLAAREIANDVRWYRGRVGSMRHGAEAVGLTVIAEDITAEKRAEAAYRHLASLVEFSNDAIIGLALDGRILSWNGGAEQIYGYAASEVRGASFSCLLAGRDPLHLGELIARARAGEEIRECALHRTKDGRDIEVSLSMAPTLDMAGTISGLSAVARDISERRALERQVLDVSDWQQRRIGRDLHDDLGQPLTGIAFLCNVLQQKLAEKGLPESMDAARVADLINHAIVKVREISRGLNPLQLEGAGLVAALQQLAATSEEFFQIKCGFHFDDSILVSGVVAEHLYRIAQEGLTNAVRHGRAKNAFIEMSQQDGGVSLSVRDDGIGIDPSRAGSGGLGLHIMRTRAQMIGADLRIESDENGGGTVIVCTLPPRVEREE